MSVLLKWSPRTPGDSQKIYRSATPFDGSSLPTELVALGASDTQFLDESPLSGNNYYMVSTIEGAREVFSSLSHVLVQSGGVTPTTPLDEFVTIINPSFETGDLTGWTVSSGNVIIADGSEYPADNASSARTGTYMIFQGVSSGGTLTQTIDVSEHALSIDAGNVQALLSVWHITDISDKTSLGLAFLDATDAEISSTVGAATTNNSSVWQEKTLDLTIPALTRSIKISLIGTKSGAGSVSQSYQDDVSLRLYEI